MVTDKRIGSPLGWILLVGFGPLLAAWLMVARSWGVPTDTVNLGELMPPGTRLDQWSLVTPKGSPWPTEGHWQLLLVNHPTCDSDCLEWARTLDAIHRATGRDRERLLFRLVSTAQPRQPIPRLVPTAPTQPPAPGIYLADPRGNLVLRYSTDTSPRAILKDLKRLLRASQIG